VLNSYLYLDSITIITSMGNDVQMYQVMTPEGLKLKGSAMDLKMEGHDAWRRNGAPNQNTITTTTTRFGVVYLFHG
jgi:hypothetical protein